MLRRKKG